MTPTPIVTISARLLLAPSVVVALALLVKGTDDVGDGFSAGVSVGLAVALGYLVRGPETVERDLPALARTPRLIVTGLALAVAAGLGPVLLGEPPFTLYPPPGQEPVTVGALKLTTGLLFEVGVFLLVAGVVIAFVHHLAGATLDPPDTGRPTEGTQ